MVHLDVGAMQWLPFLGVVVLPSVAPYDAPPAVDLLVVVLFVAPLLLKVSAVPWYE